MIMDNIDLPIWKECNNHCLTCTNMPEKMKNNTFDYEAVIGDFEKKMSNNGINNIKTVSITGGETTLCPNFFRILLHIRKRLPEAWITVLTNGRMLSYDDFRKTCLKFKKICYAVALYGHNRKIHDYITQVPGSFKQAVAGIKGMLKERNMGQEIEVRIIANRFNLGCLNEILAFIVKEMPGIDDLAIIFPEFEGMARVYQKKIGITYEEFRPAMDGLEKYLHRLKDFRLYHFPLCTVGVSFWPYVWRTLSQEEVFFPPGCADCSVKQYCLGFHKSYRDFIKNPVIKPYRGSSKIVVKETGNYYRPIDSVHLSA